MIKIAHLADIHIRNLKFHDEYRKVFAQLYEKLKEEAPDVIVVVGDLAHTKTQLSPEYFDMCASFLASLGSVSKTIVTLGNHDGNLRTIHRQDAVSPIVEALDDPNVVLLKKSGEYPLKNDIVFNNLSIFDEDNWIDPTDPEKINIALYHGSVTGCQTDLGWVMDHGESEIAIFEEFDFAMLGDIHKTNQALDKQGRVRYPGSLIQQNHSETNDKGFLLWEIESKDDFTVRHIKIENPKPFITVELTKTGKMPKGLLIPLGARLRLVSNNNLPLDRMKRAVDVAKSRFKPTSITFLNRALGDRADLDDLTLSIGDEDLRDIGVQENLMKEYLLDYEAEEKTLDRIYELNRKYNTIVEENEEVSRNVNWKLKSLEWDNLFNYGEGNYIDFDKLVGTVGIFGKNYSGKSSIIDSILYTIFNSTSKNEKKNLNCINQNKDYAQAKAEIEIDGKLYTVTRASEKYTKKLKGKETVEAKTDVDFKVYDPVLEIEEDLNGTSRADTDKRIRKAFGTLDDFLTTSMTSQLGALEFIKEGSTKRKEILAKFLDLEIFDRKFKLAKDDAADLRGALRRLEGKEYDEDIEKAREALAENEDATAEQKFTCNQLEDALNLFEGHLAGTQRSIESVPAEIIDIAGVREELKNSTWEIRSLDLANEKLIKEAADKTIKLEKLKSFISNFDFEGLKSREEQADKTSSAALDIMNALERQIEEVSRKEKKISLLGEVPCGDGFPNCKFICDAHTTKASIDHDREHLTHLESEDTRLRQELEERAPDLIREELEKYNLLLDRHNQLSREVETANLSIEKNTAISSSYEHRIAFCEEKIKNYEENKDAIENFEDLLITKQRTESNIESCKVELSLCKESTVELYKIHGSLEQKLENLENTKQELEDLRRAYSAYDLYMRCMHTNGISYDIIKRKLPIINNEIAKVLANVVDFEIFFEEEGKKLNILIKHPQYEPRPLEMGSGAEKTVAATAIRLALLSVSNLPKPNLFILDEPGTALDESNMEGFIQILDLVKSYFGTVLLISHLDSLKDSVDKQITIEKSGDFAYVNHRI
jgi:DNA repair exonuclease SbcCD ATPase subunit/DNA repair exonuclease SbcCD nuclease subunit